MKSLLPFILLGLVSGGCSDLASSESPETLTCVTSGKGPKKVIDGITVTPQMRYPFICPRVVRL
jgi:hypothetical protein